MSRCNCETYLSWGFWGDPDGPFTVQAEWQALEAAHASYCEHEETP